MNGSEFAFSVAATAKVREGSFLGAKLRYRRAYDGLALDDMIEQAIYLGPTFNIAIGRGLSLSGAWNAQVWHQSQKMGQDLGLTVLDNHVFKLRLGLEL